MIKRLRTKDTNIEQFSLILPQRFQCILGIFYRKQYKFILKNYSMYEREREKGERELYKIRI